MNMKLNVYRYVAHLSSTKQRDNWMQLRYLVPSYKADSFPENAFASERLRNYVSVVVRKT